MFTIEQFQLLTSPSRSLWACAGACEHRIKTWLDGLWEFFEWANYQGQCVHAISHRPANKLGVQNRQARPVFPTSLTCFSYFRRSNSFIYLQSSNKKGARLFQITEPIEEQSYFKLILVLFDSSMAWKRSDFKMVSQQPLNCIQVLLKAVAFYQI